MINKDKILYNANVITLNRNIPFCKAIYIKDGNIEDIGGNEYILSRYGNAPKYDMQRNTLVPAFIDAHGHFVLDSLLNGAFVDVRCAPEGTVSTREEVYKKLKKYIQFKKYSEMLIAFGFDNTLLKSQMPTADELDKISDTKPIILFHISMHKLSANHAAMKCANVSESFEVKSGRVYRDNGRLSGIFEDDEAITPFLKLAFEGNAAKQLISYVERCAKHYQCKGIATVCDGASDFNTADMLEKLIYSGQIKSRCIICPTMNKTDVPKYKSYKTSRIICGPVKIFADGGFTTYGAYLREPYFKPEDKSNPLFCGTELMSENELYIKMNMIMQSGNSFAVHCNGDASLDNVLNAYERCDSSIKSNKRNIIIHCQLADKSQLKRIYNLGLNPSFLMPHVNLWGDLHREVFFGSERAARIDPAGDALREGLVISMHNDAPVTKVDPIGLIKTAVTRTTQSGYVLGEEQRICTFDALRAVTKNVAYQYGIDAALGSIDVGKKADITMLNRDILKTPPEKLDDIVVLGLWIDGEKVFEF